MFRFLRSIRRGLLRDGTFRKYALYAIGEIFLVVIGIMIALQINNWNEERKNNRAEQKLLTALQKEFETNLEILENAIGLNTDIYETCIKIGKFTGPELPPIEEKELSEYMVGAFKFESRYIPNQGTMNEINNSGKLSLISDPSLRKALSEWQSQFELVKNQEDYVVELRDYTHQFFINNGNFRRHLDIIDDPLIDVQPSRFPDNDFDFLTLSSFESNLYLFIVASVNLNQTFYLPLKEQTKLIIEQIINHLDVGT